MNNSNYYISLDIHDTASQAVLTVKKGDNSRKISASFTENGKEYVIAEGCTAVFTAKKPDGTKLYNDCMIEDNSIMYVTTNNTTSAVGVAECEFRLLSPGDKLLVCPRFTLIVEDTVVDDGDVIDSSDEFSALSKMVGRVERADETAQRALETADVALEKANRADDLVDGCEEATKTLVLTHDDIVSGGYVKALKELNRGGKFSFWVGTTDEYNALPEKVNNCFYILTDDSSRNEILTELEQKVDRSYHDKLTDGLYFYDEPDSAGVIRKEIPINIDRGVLLVGVANNVYGYPSAEGYYGLFAVHFDKTFKDTTTGDRPFVEAVKISGNAILYFYYNSEGTAIVVESESQYAMGWWYGYTSEI